MIYFVKKNRFSFYFTNDKNSTSNTKGDYYMKLEQNSESLLFSSTKIPDIFFSEYISQASGDFIKVYLYIVFLSKYGKDIKINDLSKKLNLEFNVIKSALEFWENLGTITKKGTGYIINNLQELELHKLYKPNVSLSVEDIEKNEKNQTRAKLVEAINNQFFQGIMSPAWYADIDLWFKKYNFDDQVMWALFHTCNQNSKLYRNYMQAVAESWANSNVKTFSELEAYYTKQATSQKMENTIRKKLGIPRPLTEYEKGYIQKWTEDFGYSLDIIEIALKKTTSKTNISFNHLNTMITDWHDRDLKTSDEVQNYLVSSKVQAQNKKDFDKKLKYNNFEQRTYDNFDNFYANKQD